MICEVEGSSCPQGPMVGLVFQYPSSKSFLLTLPLLSFKVFINCLVALGICGVQSSSSIAWQSPSQIFWLV
ncbi:unnamed protein product [Moneuplotes crassus]|uniref:Uncharacterized protein n=1 Tax=Euplotes crassus TaxID=5936 RepID=A0AAD1XAN1_EUPCR|nr:unnamed protein product [Moneuplotes crassus]